MLWLQLGRTGFRAIAGDWGLVSLWLLIWFLISARSVVAKNSSSNSTADGLAGPNLKPQDPKGTTSPDNGHTPEEQHVRNILTDPTFSQAQRLSNLVLGLIFCPLIMLGFILDACLRVKANKRKKKKLYGQEISSKRQRFSFFTDKWKKMRSPNTTRKSKKKAEKPTGFKAMLGKKTQVHPLYEESVSSRGPSEGTRNNELENATNVSTSQKNPSPTVDAVESTAKVIIESTIKNSSHIVAKMLQHDRKT
nr:PREDICTED: uncharacterized protein LOC106703321 [Latimeria chalumnae]|eukprot:XP_014343408.1 PREDICTED: uncharacterized protein LOC106703321 [Latimeria chalumnae]